MWLVGPTTEDGRAILDRNHGLFTQKGVQPRSSLSWFYSQGSVLVLPSIQEGLGLVQAQAMACGLPVIATTNTGAEDLFTDGVEGFIVPIRDPLAIREKIEWLLDHPERHRQMSEAAFARVQFFNGWDTYGQRCLQMYQHVARQSATRFSS